MRLKESVFRMLSSAKPTLRRFWLAVGLTIVLTTILIAAISGDGEPDEDLVRPALALVSGVLATWCSILWWERRPHKAIRVDSQTAGNLLAAIPAALVSVLTYLLLKEFSLVSMSRYAAINLALFLVFFIIPHFRKEGDLETYVVKVFSNSVVSALFAAVMFIGLAAITFTVSSLFDLDVSFEVYMRIWLVIAGVVTPFLFMAGIPVGTLNAEAEDYPKVLRNLILFVVTPLITSYTLVLYLYFAKILITRQWPVGLVSHLVLWYSVMSTGLLFFVWPLSSANKWGDAFARHFPKLVIPLLLMMFASVGIRIRYYGITENRYYVLVLGLWVLGSMVYLNFRKNKKSIGLPATLAVVVLLSVFGPWSSYSVSKWSQNRRLEGLLTKYGMIQGESIMPATQTVSETDRREVAEILFYFDRNHKLSDVRRLPADFSFDRFGTVFGFDYGIGVPAKYVQYLEYTAGNQTIDINGYQYLFDFTGTKYRGDPIHSIDNEGINVTYNPETYKITVTMHGVQEWEHSVADFLAGLQSKYGPEDGLNNHPEDMVLLADTSHLRVKLVITGTWGRIDDQSGEAILDHLSFYLMVGKR